MGSTRLPGKVLKDIQGQPHLTRLVNRISKSRVEDIIVATSTNPLDDAIEDWGAEEGVGIHRGSEKDVLSRVVEACHGDICVRVWGDCPLIDPYFIDRGLDMIGGCDLVMGPKNRNYPHGVSPHVVHADLMRYLHDTVTDPIYREHDTLALYEKPGYRVRKFAAPDGWDMDQRLQVDYLEDWEVVNQIYKHLGEDFDTGDVVDLLKREPWIREINKDCQDKPVR